MKKVLRVFCFFFAVLFLLLTIPFTAFAAIVENPMYATNVCDDLRNMNYDLSAYPMDESADFVSVINFTEYGYDYYNDQRYYGLFIYLYNPSGKPIYNNCYVELQYVDKTNNTTKNAKYLLDIMSVSKDGINDNVFLKLRVSNSASIAKDIRKTSRDYTLNAIELKYSNKAGDKAKSFPIKGKYSFTGYQKNFDTTDENLHKLHCTYSETEVIDIELRPATWFTKTSDLGEDYRYEVSSVYFNIPDYYINKYGDINDETSGLYSVQGEYIKYLTNGLVVNDAYCYNSFMEMLKKNISLNSEYKNGSYGSDIGFYKLGSIIAPTTYSNKKINYDITYNIRNGLIKDKNSIGYEYVDVTTDETVYSICHVLSCDNEYGYVSAQDFLQIFYEQEGYHYTSSSSLAGLRNYNFGEIPN